MVSKALEGEEWKTSNEIEIKWDMGKNMKNAKYLARAKHSYKVWVWFVVFRWQNDK